MRLWLSVLFCFLAVSFAEAGPFRPQKFAAFRAHTILPNTLKFLVEKNGKHLFQGLEKGLDVQPSQVNAPLILRESDKVTDMVNRRLPFARVVKQMGYVTGLLAVFTNPALDSSPVVLEGFHYYLNLKLPRFHFVFDGYDSFRDGDATLLNELKATASVRLKHKKLLEKKYREVGNNRYYVFDERSAVFGVSSIYFSNLARLSAHLWYDAWSAAHGDTTRTPFRKKQRNRIASRP